ncbi:alpha/beta hydrolase [Gemmatimonas phototrophica]|uniref:Proline iminopeptidase n=1 Tax=Gemmatimonas phototrophica TaxID=1379270 RepID=A0A143BNI4_9BACT|nr:alpha/beta hydrolase [Gemmatimonas phototrophica]AMW06060.1 hypothetical protein GEMMAAP_17245 [Gemmatimonas phototrophica]
MLGGLLVAGPDESSAQTTGSPWQVTARGDSVQFDTLSVRLRSGERVAVRGTLRVPEWRRGTSARRVTLRWLRFSGSVGTSGPDAPPIVFLAGGPGDAGTRAISTMPVALLDFLLVAGDLIAFDQRATGTSIPLLVCAPSAAVSPDLRLTRAQRDSLSLSAAHTCLAQLQASGVQRAGYSTGESVEDLESLRIAIGVPSVSLYGGSYGTHLGLAYMQAYPKRTARAVLAGVEGPDDTFKRPSRIDAVFADISQVASRDPRFAGRRPLLEVFDSLRTQLAATTPVVTVGSSEIRLDAFDLQRFVTDALGEQRTIVTLPSQLYAMAEGKLELLAPTAMRLRAARPLNAMNLLVNCASGASAARWAAIDADIRTARLGDAMDFPANVQCRTDELRSARAAGSTRSKAVPVPVLFISGTWDGRTPVANVEELLATFTFGRHLVVPFQSHGLMGDPDVVEASLRFLRGDHVAGARLIRTAPAFRQ